MSKTVASAAEAVTDITAGTSLAVGDFALVHARLGDTDGNLVYRRTARNFNPMMAQAGRITIAEVEELVQPGELDPDEIHTPSIFVQRILKGAHYEKWIEQRTTRPREA